MKLSDIPENEKTPLVKYLLEVIRELKEENKKLQDELLKLKKETIRPKIKPSKLNNSDEDGDKKSKRKSTKGVSKKKRK
jgi:hypothetical protein